MDTDLLLTIGIILMVLTLPSLLAAWTQGRPPRFGAVMLIVGALLVVLAVTNRPSDYTVNQVPDIMLNVFARYLR